MGNGLYRAAIAMVSQQKRLESISVNLANLSTTGYKRTSSSTAQFSVQSPEGEKTGLAIESQTDFSQGNLDRTGRDLDLALFGDGFFALEGPEGEVYTRAGDFKVTSDGVLVSQEDYPVAWRSRGGAIDPTGEPVTVDGDGVMRQGNQTLGQLKLVDFKDRTQLVQTGSSIWSAPKGLEEATPTASVHQYALESSNATGMEEIIEMIAVQRSFQSVGNLIRTIQESYQRLTRSPA